MIGALVFDFDGVILDTESALFHAWVHTYEVFGGAPIEHAEWCASLGRNSSGPLSRDPLTRLLGALGPDVSGEEVQAVRRAERDRLLAKASVAAGLDALLDQALELRVPVAIASSSPRHWIERHLGPRGLLERFPVIACAGDEVAGKPHPAVYLNACSELGVDPACAVAIEDSPHGVTAAKAAGMLCIAVPTDVSATLDFSHADAVVDGLDCIDLRHLPSTPAR